MWDTTKRVASVKHLANNSTSLKSATDLQSSSKWNRWMAARLRDSQTYWANLRCLSKAMDRKAHRRDRNPILTKFNKADWCYQTIHSSSLGKSQPNLQMPPNGTKRRANEMTASLRKTCTRPLQAKISPLNSPHHTKNALKLRPSAKVRILNSKKWSKIRYRTIS